MSVFCQGTNLKAWAASRLAYFFLLKGLWAILAKKARLILHHTSLHTVVFQTYIFFSLIASPTSFFVEDQFCLKLPPFVQRRLDLCHQLITGLGSIQEVTRAAFLHQFRPGIAGELTEAIGTVNDRVEGLDLCIPQHKVTVCLRKKQREK